MTESTSPAPGSPSGPASASLAGAGAGWVDATATLDPADVVAAAALAVPGVAGLHAGTFSEVGTYLPGRRVDGVRLRDDVAEVHVVLTWGVDVRATADAIREALAPLTGTPVDVCVEDVVPAVDVASDPS